MDLMLGEGFPPPLEVDVDVAALFSLIYSLGISIHKS
jgi:hypothetical protein